MIAAYLDESARNSNYYFIGGLIVDSPAAIRLERSMNSVAQMVAGQIRGFDPQTELHAYEIWNGHEGWANVPVPMRARVCKIAAKAIKESGAKVIFRGIDLDALAAKYSNPHPAHELALSHALESVDRIAESDYGDEIAFVLADEHHTARDGRTRFRSLRLGNASGFSRRTLTRLADTLYFGPSHHSRLLQAADIATYFLNRAQTVKESDSRSADVMKEISIQLNTATRFSYTWVPR